MLRLADDLLDDCLCQPQAPLGKSPSRYLIDDKHAAKTQLAALKPWLAEQQTMLWANRRDAVLLLLQGPDCSGKDGVIRRVLSACNPQALQVSSFQEPDAAENQRDFLARYQARLPAPGLLGVFNRSYYEGLTSDRRDGLCRLADLPVREQRIARLEQQLAGQRIHLLKCYLHISHEEQTLRLRRRLELPSKRWKLKASDLTAWQQFQARQQEWAEVLQHSHSAAAPWYVIPAEHRWQRDLLLASLLAREFERLQLSWPERPAPFTAQDLELGA